MENTGADTFTVTEENSPVDRAQQDELIAKFGEVFNNELILKSILENAIFKKGEIQRTTICSLRLVNSIWQDEVEQMMRKKGKPLFQFVLNKTCSLTENVWLDVGERKKLDEFVEICLNIRPPNSPPSFRLRIQPCFFLASAFRISSYYYLSQCAAGLVELELTFPHYRRDPCSSGALLLPVSFPRLRKLILNFTGKPAPRCAQVDLVSQGQVQLIQSLLNGAPTLQEFLVPLASWAPEYFEAIILPQSVSTLQLACRWKTVQVRQFFAQNRLQRLAKLTLRAGTYLLPGDVLFIILSRYRRTLEHLIITQGSNASFDRNMLQFPVMESLKTLHIIGELGKTAQVDVDCFPRCFPNLVELSFLHQYEQDFKNFTESPTILPTVKHLDLELWLNRETPVLSSFHSDRLQRVNASFPNLSSLSLSTWLHSCTLQYIFQEMSQLEALSITVPHLQLGLPKCWDGCLIGDTGRSGVCRCVACELELKSVKPSIRLMTRLTRLSLISAINPIHTDDCGPLISDEAFHQAFFKMDNLMELKLGGRFSPSALMIQEWEKRGRTFLTPSKPAAPYRCSHP